MSKVVITGSINLDLFVHLERWPGVGETVTSTNFVRALGGKGANQAIAAARLGGNAHFIGAIGQDEQGSFVSDALQEDGLECHIDTHSDCGTGLAIIDLGPGGENIIRLVPGANGVLAARDVQQRGSVFSGAKVALLQNEIPLKTSIAAAHAARAAGAIVIMDPAPAPPPGNWTPEVFAAFDVLTPNSTEVEAITGYAPTSPECAQRAAKDISKLTGCDVIVTMGGDGAAWCQINATGWCPAEKVKAIDTVAAGDCFNAAFAVALAEGQAWDQSVKFATKAAAVSTTRSGAAASLPMRWEIPG